MKTGQRDKLFDALIALALALVAIAVLIPAYSYSRASGIFPVFIGWIFLALSLLEFGLHVAALLRPETSDQSGAAVKSSTTWSGDIGGLLWLAAIVGLLYLLGFLVATPLFVFAMLWYSAKRSAAYSLVFAMITTAFIYIVFVRLLNYQLFAGVLIASLTR